MEAVIQLHEAIRQLDEASCRDLLSSGVNINAIYKRATAVTLAAEVGHWPIWSLLMEHSSFSPDATDQLEATPLYHAALHGNTEIARSLLDLGASVNRPDLGRVTPLSATGYYDSVEVAEMLLCRGADVNIMDAKGMTPLSRAASNLSVGVVKVLLRHEADVNPQAVAKTTVAPPLVEAVRPSSLPSTLEKRARAVEIMRLLIQHGCDLDAVDVTGDTPLHRAVINRQMVPASLLLVSVCQLEKRNLQGRKPIHEAIARGDADMATLLLVHGSDANAPCSSLVTQNDPSGLPLLAALLNSENNFSHGAFLSHILAVADVSGAKGNEVVEQIRCSALLDDATKETVLEALERARRKGLKNACVRTIRSLLRGRTARGCCFLNLIERLPLPDSLKRLLAADADYQTENPMAACNLHLAIATRDSEKIHSVPLKSIDPDVLVDGQTALMATIAHNPPHDEVFDVLDLLTKAGANINAANASGMTSLHIAAAMGREDIVDWLLERGSDVTAQAHGKTAADMAAEGLHLTLAVKLVTKEPRPAQKRAGSCGTSMLHWAAVAGDADALGRLLELKMDPDVLDASGNSPLHVAASCGTLYAGVLAQSQVTAQVSRDRVRSLRAVDKASYLEVAELLIKYGCQTDRCNLYRDTPLTLAQKHKFKDMELLLTRSSSLP